jgi:hypothetical protein
MPGIWISPRCNPGLSFGTLRLTHRMSLMGREFQFATYKSSRWAALLVAATVAIHSTCR